MEDESRGGGGDAAEKFGSGSQGAAFESGLRWLAAHCRFVTTMLPRGELGVSFAAQLLAGLADACRRRVPDLSGTGPEVFSLAVDYGILEEMPSPRVMRAVPRLIAERSPLFEARGKRHWTLWIVHALDPAILGKIQRRTPASQLEVCEPKPRRGGGRRSREDVAAEAHRLAAALASEQAAAAESRAREEALTRALAEKVATLDRVLLDAAELAGANAALRRLQGAHEGLAEEHRKLRGEVEPLRAALAREQTEKARLQGALAQVSEANRQLEAKLEKFAKMDAASKLAGDIWSVIKAT